MQAPVAGDKTYTLFEALVAAKLNGGEYCGCPDIADIIEAADAWIFVHPVGVGVAANSDAWQGFGDDLYEELDDFNNGELCDDDGDCKFCDDGDESGDEEKDDDVRKPKYK
ncbi:MULTISPECIES: DNA polymerase V family protein [Methanococcoides]|uniref:Uncharacterized protein n=1 Tax=Methanococcoides seepicolus TaxID=2828780 RepID=A0A9E4ZBV1_9EURY|nr:MULTISPECIES: DNA polymerase V family protein [Methanococcoides]MCM1985746.1 hypothetical protein [Methanococcoides seepicolus]